MDVTRRDFLASATALASVLPLDLGRLRCLISASRDSSGVALVDLKEQCGLSESRAGYEQALADSNIRWSRVDSLYSSSSRIVIIPGTLAISSALAHSIASCVQTGSTVILESGAGFATDTEWRSHRAALRKWLRLDIGAPISVCPEDGRSRHAPYVEFSWPSAMLIRDFSRIVPVASTDGEVIAWAGGVPAALRRRNGLGTLIFLGSPIGPALWAGDHAARRWLLDTLGADADDDAIRSRQ